MKQPQPLPMPVATPFTDDKTQSGVNWPWLRWLQQLATEVTQLGATPGPYADDVTAKAAGVNIGERYYQSTGAVVVRLT